MIQLPWIAKCNLCRHTHTHTQLHKHTAGKEEGGGGVDITKSIIELNWAHTPWPLASHANRLMLTEPIWRATFAKIGSRCATPCRRQDGNRWDDVFNIHAEVVRHMSQGSYGTMNRWIGDGDVHCGRALNILCKNKWFTMHRHTIPQVKNNYEWHLPRVRCCSILTIHGRVSGTGNRTSFRTDAFSGAAISASLRFVYQKWSDFTKIHLSGRCTSFLGYYAAFACAISSKFHPQWPSIMAFNWISDNFDLLFASSFDIIISFAVLRMNQRRQMPMLNGGRMMRACVIVIIKWNLCMASMATWHFDDLFFLRKIQWIPIWWLLSQRHFAFAFFAIRLAHSRNFAALVYTNDTPCRCHHTYFMISIDIYERI